MAKGEITVRVNGINFKVKMFNIFNKEYCVESVKLYEYDVTSILSKKVLRKIAKELHKYVEKQ